jgi:uncharacterized protein
MIEFDSAKDRRNIAKHGLSPAEAERFDWDSATIHEDRSEAYGEFRFRAVGLIGSALHSLVFTPRGEIIRAISLRKATRAERREWAN